MRFGIHVPTHGPHGDPALLRDLAVAAEAAGWDGWKLPLAELRRRIAAGRPTV